MVNQQSSFDSVVQDSRLGKTPPNCRSVELHVSPTMLVDLVLKDNVGSFKVRTLLDSGSGTSWCHIDLLRHVKYNDLGSLTMQVQVFEGCRKKRYQYVELFYTVDGKVGTIKCFVTDQYSWFNEIKGLAEYAANQLSEDTIIDPGTPCDHDKGKKEIALILGPYASNKLRNRNVSNKFSGDLLFESYKIGGSSAFVFSGLVPRKLNRNVIYSYKITPMIQEHLDVQGLKRGEIEFEPHLDQDKFDLLQNLEFLWSKEILGVKPNEYRKTDEIAIEKFHDSVEWHEDVKRYSVGMPFNYRIERLRQNKELAYARLFQLMKRFAQDPKFAVAYALVIKDYIEKYAEEVVNPEAPAEGPICYLPHRAVIRQDRTTTKLRIVFDGSAKCGRDEVCLNDCLMQGPNLVQCIASCLINFRTRNYAFSADLEKAFLQILIKLEHRDVLRFLFPIDPLNPLSQVKVYRFKVVIFGANSSPFHLAAVIVKHLHIHVKDKHTRDTLLRGLYVDNLFQTRNSPDQLVNLFHECRYLFFGAGMNLRSWRSDLKAVNKLAEEHEVLEENPEIKVLGMLWNTESSTITLQGKPKWSGKYCKRDVLSFANQCYDPLGLVVPVEVRMRIFLQGLWKKGLSWERLFSECPELVLDWDLLRKDCHLVLTKVLPRSVCNGEVADLHVFCDSSKYIYGAAAYVVSPEGSGFKSELVKAKAKIVGTDGPPKTNTIPKLELMSLVIGSNLAVYCIDALFHIKINSLFLWNDSKTALYWCSSYDIKEEFVSNRIRTIRQNVPRAKLMYIKSEMNPADILTRQPRAESLLSNSTWWHGPDFLRGPVEDWPVQNQVFNLMPEVSMEKEFVGTQSGSEANNTNLDDLRPDLIKASRAEKVSVPVELKKVTTMKVGVLSDSDSESENDFVGFSEADSVNDFRGFPQRSEVKEKSPTVQYQADDIYVDWEHWNSFSGLLRSYARVFSAIDAFKARLMQVQVRAYDESLVTPLTALHFRSAKRFLLKQMQLECYAGELKVLKQGRPVKQGSCRLFGLFLDGNGVIRCKGRYENSPSLQDINLPVLCGTNHPLTKLLLWNIHDKENCPGYSYAMHRIKKDLYFPKFKVALRKTLDSCAKCKIHKSRAYAYPGNPPLPAYRTEAKTPFEYVGLDYAGPFEIQSHDFRGKLWICLFTCLITRACHLVMVPNTSTKTFLDALQELSTFYRMPRLLLSDNATQFHAADRLLRQLQKSKVVQDALGANEILWHFIPARASHIGGVFERMIGIMKVELRKMSCGTKLTLQEAKVHILEVQRIVNNRPLTRANASLDDVSCITPMDLIRGYKDKTSIFPEVYVDEFLEDLWETKQDLPQQYLRKKINRENFFKNLHEGYFEMLRFSSPGTPQKQGQGQSHRLPKVGDVVLIKEDTLRVDWPKGIIVELPVSSDGKIRRAKVMNSKKHLLDRAICDLHSLEIDAEQVIPAYLDSRLNINNSSQEDCGVRGRPQRLSAVAGRTKTSGLYVAGEA